MFSINKIIWLIIILAVIWYAFKFIEKKNKSKKKEFKKENEEKKNIDAFKCPICGLWSTDDTCNNYKCSSNS